MDIFGVEEVEIARLQQHLGAGDFLCLGIGFEFAGAQQGLDLVVGVAVVDEGLAVGLGALQTEHRGELVFETGDGVFGLF